METTNTTATTLAENTDWKYLPDSCLAGCGKADADGQGQCRNGDISLGKAAVRHHLDAGGQDRSKHHDSTASKHRIRQGSKEIAHWRKESCKDHTGCARHNRKTVDYLCHIDQTYVL